MYAHIYSFALTFKLMQLDIFVITRKTTLAAETGIERISGNQ